MYTDQLIEHFAFQLKSWFNPDQEQAWFCAQDADTGPVLIIQEPNRPQCDLGTPHSHSNPLPPPPKECLVKMNYYYYYFFQ